jgi:mono/diheme cytochrome c family protein
LRRCDVRFERFSGLHHIRASGSPATASPEPSKTSGLYLLELGESNMCERFRHALGIVLVTAALPIALAAHGVQQHQHPTEGGAHKHPEAAKLKNPVAVTPESIAAGQKVYAQNCASCHGETGKGDGRMGAELKPPPSNVADADWKHGATDGEIFTVVRDGIRTTPMKSFKSKLTTDQMWQVVNYRRSLGPKS